MVGATTFRCDSSVQKVGISRDTAEDGVDELHLVSFKSSEKGCQMYDMLGRCAVVTHRIIKVHVTFGQFIGHSMFARGTAPGVPAAPRRVTSHPTMLAA